MNSLGPWSNDGTRAPATLCYSHNWHLAMPGLILGMQGYHIKFPYKYHLFVLFRLEWYAEFMYLHLTQTFHLIQNTFIA